MNCASLVGTMIQSLESRTLLSVVQAAPPADTAAGLAAIDDTVYFAGGNEKIGMELWKTDGSRAGTKLVKETLPGHLGGLPSRFVVAGDKLFFTAADARGRRSLWVTEGTADTTIRLRTGDYDKVAAVGGTLYFMVPRRVGAQLWVSDGTVAGTRMVKDNQPMPELMVGAQRTLYMMCTGSAPAAPGGYQATIYASDGTAKGTRRVAQYVSSGAVPDRLQTVNDTLVYQAQGVGASQMQLWRATRTGTSVIGPASISRSTPDVVKLGNRLYYAVNGSAGPELWRTDGTAMGTIKVGALGVPLMYGTTAGTVAAGAPTLYAADRWILGVYRYPESALGHDEAELWRINPASASMRKIVHYSPVINPEDDYPRVGLTDFQSVTGGIVFNLNTDISKPDQLYFSNGLASGTKPVTNKFGSVSIQDPVDTGRQLFFIDGEARFAGNLWVWNYSGNQALHKV